VFHSARGGIRIRAGTCGLLYLALGAIAVVCPRPEPSANTPLEVRTGGGIRAADTARVDRGVEILELADPCELASDETLIGVEVAGSQVGTSWSVPAASTWA
jgi:hypothetical protein